MSRRRWVSLERELAELERADPKVRAARERLDKVTAEIAAKGREARECFAALFDFLGRCRK